MLRIKAREESPPEPIANERDVFSIAGPTYLTSVDWTCPNHRRVITAVLVKSVYLLEFDRQENRIGDEALAPPWWEFFHFNPVKLLVDDVDYSIFGAIFEFKPLTTPTEDHIHSENPTLDTAPKYIVAFRGTITTKDSRSRDISLDLSICQNGLHRTTRSALAIQAVKDVLSVTGVSSKVWLAGHSLGSSIATVAGKEMARSGDFLDTFLFNPPFFFAPIEKIRIEQIKTGIRVARSLIVAGASFAVKSLQKDKDSSFATLSAWVPQIFAHPDDPICSGFIGYFRHRTKMEEMGAGAIERLATQNCIGDLFWSAIGKESDPLHLLPSASLTVNLRRRRDMRKAHTLDQWWELDSNLHTKLYTYNEERDSSKKNEECESLKKNEECECESTKKNDECDSSKKNEERETAN